MDHRYPIISLAAIGAATLFIGHTALQFLPPTLWRAADDRCC